MALRKEPARRYASVQQLAEDIRRHLERLPVLAHKDTLAYRGGKFVQRHKIGALAAILILLALLGGVIAFARQARIAAAQRDQAQLEKANAERVSVFLQNVLLLADPSWVGGSGGTRGHELTTEKLLETAATRARKELTDQPEVLGAVLRSIGSAYRAQGEYAQAENALREARAIFIRVAGETSWDTINVTYNLAQCLSQAGEFAEADALYRKLVPSVRQRTNREDDHQVLLLAGMLNDYAFLLRLEGRPKAAEALLREALQFASRWQGADRAIVAIHLSVLGLARDDQGDLEGAEKIERAAIADLRQLPGGDRVELGTILFCLGQILTTKGQLAEAEKAIQEGLDICRRLLGDRHPYVAIGQYRLAAVQCARTNYGEAQRLAKEAIAIQEAKIPQEHISRAYPLTILGLALTRSQQAADAEPFLRRALALRERTLPPGNWLLAETKIALGESLHAQGRKVEAEPLIASGSEAIVQAFGRRHPRAIAATAVRDRLARED
ncbi:hypothetical protein BH20VER3_BH20VER3_06670 [soil metagenome]